MIKHETKWQTVWNQYLREKQIHGFFELKVTTLDYFPFAKMEQVQYEGLQSTEKHGLVWKLSDADMRPKPCDCFSIPPLPSYLVIKFLDGFYLIRISDIVKMRDAGSIAISRQQAELMAEKIIKVDNKTK